MTVQNARILHGNPERNYLYHRSVEYRYIYYSCTRYIGQGSLLVGSYSIIRPCIRCLSLIRTQVPASGNFPDAGRFDRLSGQAIATAKNGPGLI